MNKITFKPNIDRYHTASLDFNFETLQLRLHL